MSISAIASSTAAVTSPSTAYSDGTSEVETSASTPGGQGNQSGQTYNAQGALGANTTTPLVRPVRPPASERMRRPVQRGDGQKRPAAPARTSPNPS